MTAGATSATRAPERNPVSDVATPAKPEPLRRPEWLKVRLKSADTISRMKPLLTGLHTVCESARCPNVGECWGRGTATFMILGDVCTRRCTFCAVPQGEAGPPDPLEPGRLADVVVRLGLAHTVITSVTRDDLPDQGANQFRLCIEEVRRKQPNCTIEVLIPDFQGNWEALEIVLEARPEVLNHNIETVPRLYRRVRPHAVYRQSLELLARARKRGESKVKSGLMVGLGETTDEVVATMDDLYAHGVQILTIGQYLKPREHRIEVERFVHPDEFAEFKRVAVAKGFEHCESGPLVRSSYHAESHVARPLLENTGS
jgi:lipoic acid synthetase